MIIIIIIIIVLIIIIIIIIIVHRLHNYRLGSMTTFLAMEESSSALILPLSRSVRRMGEPSQE